MIALLCVAVFIAASSVWLSYRPLRQLRQADGKVLVELGRLPRTPTLAGLTAQIGKLPPGPVRDAIQAVLSANNAGEAMFAVTEISLMAQGEVRRVGYLPRVLARVSMATGTLLALVVLSQTVPTGRVGVHEAALSFAAGVAGAVGCALIGRQLDALVEKRREAWTGLLDALGQVTEDTHLTTVAPEVDNPSVDLGPEAD